MKIRYFPQLDVVILQNGMDSIFYDIIFHNRNDLASYFFNVAIKVVQKRILTKRNR